MFSVYYEEYRNDYNRRDYVKSFYSPDEIEEWLFGQMKRNYTNDPLAMYFPQEADKGAISINPSYESPNIWIHQITSADGIIFSDGTRTAGQKFMSKKVKEWMKHCKERRDNPVFNFAE